MLRDGHLEELVEPEANNTVKDIINAYSVCIRARRYKPDGVPAPLDIASVRDYYDYYRPAVPKRLLCHCIFALDERFGAGAGNTRDTD